MLSLNEYKLAIKDSLEGDQPADQIISCWYGQYKKRYDESKETYLLKSKGIIYKKDGQAVVETKTVGEEPLMDIEERVALKYINLKRSASRRQKDFDLKLADIRRLVTRKTCYYTGVSIGIYEDQHPNQLTIDRLDPEKGYDKGNVVACSHTANQFKNKIEHDFHGVLTREQVFKVVGKMFK